MAGAPSTMQNEASKIQNHQVHRASKVDAVLPNGESKEIPAIDNVVIGSIGNDPQIMDMKFNSGPPLMPGPGDAPVFFAPNGFSPHYYYDYNTGGYVESPYFSPEQWEEYMRFLAAESPDGQHQGFGFIPPPYASYGLGSPAMVGGQLLGPSSFPFQGPQFFSPTSQNQSSGKPADSHMRLNGQLKNNNQGSQHRNMGLNGAVHSNGHANGNHPQGPVLKGCNPQITSFSRGRGLMMNGPDSRSVVSKGFNNSLDKSKPRAKTGFSNSGAGFNDIAMEQNRGPRTFRVKTPKTVGTESKEVVDNAESQYNRPDFNTSCAKARFFVIKSYSEDDVHKSIKYNVWASTPSGNKRLDAAYHDAQKLSTDSKSCPVFLFYSVNASGQFCGVAEMVSPVDFTKSVEYWQQDKWNGQFQVKWHVVKDVPNGILRHIVLANNEGKPVTNSRDTQEIEYEQGMEMLNIFKNYAARTSILEDFSFYDGRQRAMQERKERQQLLLQQTQQQFQFLHVNNNFPVQRQKPARELTGQQNPRISAAANGKSPTVQKNSGISEGLLLERVTPELNQSSEEDGSGLLSKGASLEEGDCAVQAVTGSEGSQHEGAAAAARSETRDLKPDSVGQPAQPAAVVPT
eukprot:TRINITY_DN16079_c0_g1_i6.p1 TRINITY_DN16079_c0_g1~~TRINITY_DN16079_c0_g1_i6.p1  ORF type:complete len:627 (+),score=109.23 TRINITY_DN16079_c0_g1_i6:117-1997(+)